MRGAPIILYNRYTGQTEQEAVYGEAALRFAYENPLGRWLTWLVVARPLVSRLFGWRMRQPASARKVAPFVRRYGIDASEFSRPLEDYRSFNDFFTRELKPGARPVDADPDSVVFPADGRHLGWQQLGAEQQVFVKGQAWDLPALLGDASLARRYAGGTLVLSRLCPVDYHHFHYPVGGSVRARQAISGRLYSVSPIALRRRLAFIWENRRILTRIRSERFGEVVFMEIGATNVGSIRQRPLPDDRRVAMGDPKGWFEFGGSSVITLFEPGRVRLSADLLEQSARGIELYARVGDRMGAAPH
jgi:phosphatidylserine decarboxylase